MLPTAVCLLTLLGAALFVAFSQGFAAPPVATDNVDGAREPRPITGVPLGRRTGLHLLVADLPPFVLDVDSGRTVPVRGISRRGAGVGVLAVGRGGAVVRVVTARTTELYGVRGLHRRISFLGTGRTVWPSSEGRAVWVQSHIAPARCALRKVGLDGRLVRPREPFPCASPHAVPSAGPLGLVVDPDRVIDPITKETTLKTDLEIVAMAANTVLLADRQSRELALIDIATGVKKPLTWPSRLWGLGGAAVDPSGRFVAISFASPGWTDVAGQAFDLWLLEVETAKLMPVAGMPTFVMLKRTGMAWTRDGRLILLAQERSGRSKLAVWRPGDRRLGVASVRMPRRLVSAGRSFAVLRE